MVGNYHFHFKLVVFGGPGTSLLRKHCKVPSFRLNQHVSTVLVRLETVRCGTGLIFTGKKNTSCFSDMFCLFQGWFQKCRSSQVTGTVGENYGNGGNFTLTSWLRQPTKTNKDRHNYTHEVSHDSPEIHRILRRFLLESIVFRVPFVKLWVSSPGVFVLVMVEHAAPLKLRRQHLQ